MSLPTRNSYHPRSRSSAASSSPSCLPCMLFISLSALFFFKVHVFMSKNKAAGIRDTLDMTQAHLLMTPISYNNESRLAELYPNATFYKNFEIAWGDDRARILNKGELLKLILDRKSGSGFQSKHEYLFGRIDMQLKLVAGNSAGTVTTYYMSSDGSKHDEIDFEFLGNSSGNPYTLHTNVFSQGQGNREQQFLLWFDPTTDFHTYSLIWNPYRIIFYVDDTPIREFKNYQSIGVPFPKDQPMRIYSSLWNADEWATQGGRVKTDWSLAPFTASYQNFMADACVVSSGKSSCSTGSPSSDPRNKKWYTQGLNLVERQKLRKIQKRYMIYNYCRDKFRFPDGMAPECKRLV